VNAFISHSSKDNEFALRLAGDLQARAGIEVWVDRWEIQPGDGIPERIEQGLSWANLLILVLSPDSASSRWVEWERQAWLAMQIEDEKAAMEESRPRMRHLIPVLYRDCPIPPFLQHLHHVRISEAEYDEGFERLTQAVQGKAAEIERAERVGIPTGARPDVAPRLMALQLLKRLMPAQFDEVVFVYAMPTAYLPAQAPQVVRAIALIEYAAQQEGGGLHRLLDTVHGVAPHLRGRV